MAAVTGSTRTRFEVLARGSAVFVVCTVVAACSSVPDRRSGRIDPRYGVSASAKVVPDGQPIPKGGGREQVGKPYVIGGRVYTPREDPDYDRTGTASWYGADFHGRLTANGEVYDRMSLSAAHPTMPLPSYARVTNLQNGRSVIVRVNDRGPYHGNREIDLSERTAELLEFKGRGLTDVRVQYVGRAPVEGSDDRVLAATLTTGEPSIARDRVMIARAGGVAPDDGHVRVADASGTLAAPRATAAPPAPVRAAPAYDRDGLAAVARPRAPTPRPQPQRMPEPDDDDGPIGAAPAADGRPMPAEYGPAPGLRGPVYQFRPGPQPYGYRLSYAGEAGGAAEAGRLFAPMGPGADFRTLGSAGRGARATAAIELGAYADRANADRLAARMAVFGPVARTERRHADGRVLTALSIETDVRDAEAALAAARGYGAADARRAR